MVALTAGLVSVALVALVVFVTFKLILGVKAYRKKCWYYAQFPHNKGHFIWGNLFEVKQFFFFSFNMERKNF